ncbi:DUF6266 family protein [Gaoshiqia sediminis]|uniref:DUF6266 family protein n=1 Tax=Gaoshiqia sediminis TaxID=2986998 RepID=A0AA41Y708_9BACT|nr:DUF6266 family protein [Gaoshiqia sediminis]MCW0483114.1 DUF6266 family protein [Gaoshiqia sediminis]
MARTKSFPGLYLSGKIGNLVFVPYGDEVIVRSLPERRKPGSWSEKQQQQRKRFQAARVFYNSVRESVVIPIWKLSATKKLTAYNLFLKANLGAFDKNGELADYSRLHFSTGPLPQPQQLTAARSADNSSQVVLCWNPEAQSKAESAGDELLCMWAREGQLLGPIATGSIRSEGQSILEHPSVEGGESWNLYLFFRNKNHTSYSDDKHFQL